MKIKTLLLLILAIIAGCGKETVVTGTVYDYKTRKPADNITVEIIRIHAFRKSTLGTTTTNSDGHFSISYNGSVDKVHAISEDDTAGPVDSASVNVISHSTNNVILFARQK